MIFVLDIGNTNTVLGVFSEDELKYSWRIRTDRHKTEDELGILFKSLFDYEGLQFNEVKAIIISSVVPPIMRALEGMCQKYFHIEPLIIGGQGVQTHLDIKYPRPQEIGADRIVNAVGALALYEPPFVIIDFGTATTFCYIDKQGAYYGGIISPGIKISMDALYQHAAKLPKIEIQKPDNIIGKSTEGAMESGLYYGYVGQVDGIVTRMSREMQAEPTVIATGGLASLIAAGSETIHHVETYLTLIGLYTIYQKNKDA